MRSKQLAKFHDDISTLNKHYSHFLFLNEQFFLDHDLSIKETPERLTGEVFSKNSFAEQFKVTLGQLPSEVEGTKNFITRSLFLLSFFQFEVYLKDVYYFAQSLINELPDLSHKISVVTQFQTQVNPVELGFLHQKEMDTADYFHLLRNSFVHRDLSRLSQGELLKRIKASGKSLNKFWQEASLKLIAWDFTAKKEELTSFSHSEIIDILNILRCLAEKFDNAIMAKIGDEKLQASLIAGFWEKYEHLRDSGDVNIRVGKFKHHALLTYAIQYSDEDVKRFLGE